MTGKDVKILPLSTSFYVEPTARQNFNVDPRQRNEKTSKLEILHAMQFSLSHRRGTKNIKKHDLYNQTPSRGRPLLPE
jgi:hypothetical protein